MGWDDDIGSNPSKAFLRVYFLSVAVEGKGEYVGNLAL